MIHIFIILLIFKVLQLNVYDYQIVSLAFSLIFHLDDIIHNKMVSHNLILFLIGMILLHKVLMEVVK